MTRTLRLPGGQSLCGERTRARSETDFGGLSKTLRGLGVGCHLAGRKISSPGRVVAYSFGKASAFILRECHTRTL